MYEGYLDAIGFIHACSLLLVYASFYVSCKFACFSHVCVCACAQLICIPFLCTIHTQGEGAEGEGAEGEGAQGEGAEGEGAEGEGAEGEGAEGEGAEGGVWTMSYSIM